MAQGTTSEHAGAPPGGGAAFNQKHLLLGLVLVALFMKFPFFANPPVDWDEGVYLFLSANMSWGMAHYTTQGSMIDETLPHNVYASPVFHHPPLVPYAIKLLGVVFKPPIVAGRMLNLALAVLSVLLIYRIGFILSGQTGALAAAFLWLVCPIFNLESSLIHLDFPLTFLLLAGFWAYLRYRPGACRRGWLCLSGAAFALAMLTKFTAPIYVLVPVCLALCDDEFPREWRRLLPFAGIVLAGFAWWLYVTVRFGTPLPAAFVGVRQGKSFESTYLAAIANRRWYHLWLYFVAICPLSLVYLGAVARGAVDLCRRFPAFMSAPREFRLLVALNGSMIGAVIVLCVVNARFNGYWLTRHVMPIFSVVYITLGALIPRLLARRNDVVNAYLVVLLLLTGVAMGSSLFVTMSNQQGLEPVPTMLLWTPGLETLVH